MHELGEGTSVIGLSESTTPLTILDEVLGSGLGTAFGDASTKQELGEGTPIIGLFESTTSTQDEAGSDIGTSLEGASTIQEFGEGTSDRTSPTLVFEVAGSSPCNTRAKAYTHKLRQQQLERGSSATGYKVWKDGRWVAKKVFYGLNHPDFEKEVAVFKSLSHPNIMSLLDYGKEKDSWYIYMELMDCDLLQLMQELWEHKCDSSPFTIEEAVRIIGQLSEVPNILIKLRENACVIAS